MCVCKCLCVCVWGGGGGGVRGVVLDVPVIPKIIDPFPVFSNTYFKNFHVRCSPKLA